ncbi:hypothetical protein BG015_006728 [Linnemannia schmuckeri]|uniref:Uncharacterized protein n=1 Tax=Linnemannia schmuckeri TaxID=64567 RepID=A0A9P5S1P5_9FUNG|nr:hypothetical protein BG015_006728 [Linnemannia schmuckeri]
MHGLLRKEHLHRERGDKNNEPLTEKENDDDENLRAQFAALELELNAEGESQLHARLVVRRAKARELEENWRETAQFNAQIEAVNAKNVALKHGVKDRLKYCKIVREMLEKGQQLREKDPYVRDVLVLEPTGEE